MAVITINAYDITACSLLKGDIKTNAFAWYAGEAYAESPEASGGVSIRKAGTSGKCIKLLIFV